MKNSLCRIRPSDNRGTPSAPIVHMLPARLVRLPRGTSTQRRHATGLLFPRLCLVLALTPLLPALAAPPMHASGRPEAPDSLFPPEDPPARRAVEEHIAGLQPDDLEQIFHRFRLEDEPGLTAAVFHAGEEVYRDQWGAASLEHRVAISERTRFFMGRLSKQVTAALVALLIAEGELSLDDRIGPFLEDRVAWPDWGEEIQVRHLIYHTSGLPDVYAVLRVADASVVDPMTLDQYLEVIGSVAEPLNEPGSSFHRTESNYKVLAAVIEEVTRQPLSEFAEERLFEPLGMEDTHIHDDRRRVVPDRAIGYERGADHFRRAYHNTFQGYGGTGVYSTVRDWGRWITFLAEDPLELGEEFYRLFYTPGVTDAGDRVDYAFGVEVGTWQGQSMVGHGAEFMGFSHDFRYYPSYDVGVLVLSNRADVDARALTRRMSAVVLVDAVNEWLERYSGRFHSPELEIDYTVRAEDGRLILDRPGAEPTSLVYTGDDTWRAGGWRFRFSVGPQQAPLDMYALAPGASREEDYNGDGQTQADRFHLDTGRVRGLEFVRR